MTIPCNGSLPFFGYAMKLQPIPVRSEWLHELVIDLFLYLTPVCLVVGTLGNILSVTVFLRPAMSSLVSRSRFILISAMDVIILYGCLLPMFLAVGNIYGFCDLETAFINIWIQESLIMTDAWILALVTFERTLAIFRPISTWTGNGNRKRCCSWVNGILMALPLICFFLCLPQLFQPILQMTILYRFSNIIAVSNTILSTAVPFVFMLCLDIAILIKLYGSPLSGLEKEKEKENNGWVTRIRRKAIRKKTGSNPDSSGGGESGGGEITPNENENGKKNKGSIKKAGKNHVTAGRKSARSRALQSVKMILLVDIVAILLNLPIIIIIILNINNEALSNVARFLVYTRHAINFTFYFTSSQFRRETTSVLCCCFRRSVPGGTSTTALSTITGRINM